MTDKYMIRPTQVGGSRIWIQEGWIQDLDSGAQGVGTGGRTETNSLVQGARARGPPVGLLFWPLLRGADNHWDIQQSAGGPPADAAVRYSTLILVLLPGEGEAFIVHRSIFFRGTQHNSRPPEALPQSIGRKEHPLLHQQSHYHASSMIHPLSLS